MVASRFLLARAGLAAGFLASTGCSLVVKTDADQCTENADCAARGPDFAGTVCIAHVCLECGADADCTARGAEFANSACVANVCQTKVDPKWGCIGHVDPPMPGSMVTAGAKILDLVSTEPVKNFTAKLCSKYDPQCSSPLSPPKLAADGSATVTVASDFQGYLDVQAPGYLPALVFLDLTAIATNPVILLLPTAVIDNLAMGAKVLRDPAAGIVLGRTVDCEYKPSAGVSVSIFPSTTETAFYVIGSGVSPGATPPRPSSAPRSKATSTRRSASARTTWRPSSRRRSPPIASRSGS